MDLTTNALMVSNRSNDPAGRLHVFTQIISLSQSALPRDIVDVVLYFSSRCGRIRTGWRDARGRMSVMNAVTQQANTFRAAAVATQIFPRSIDETQMPAR